MRYFKITMQRGHVRTGYNHACITFYYKARNLLEAMDFAKRQGGVKHSRLPLNAQEIDEAEYNRGIAVNAYVRAGAKLE